MSLKKTVERLHFDIRTPLSALDRIVTLDAVASLPPTVCETVAA